MERLLSENEELKCALSSANVEIISLKTELDHSLSLHEQRLNDLSVKLVVRANADQKTIKGLFSIPILFFHQILPICVLLFRFFNLFIKTNFSSLGPI